MSDDVVGALAVAMAFLAGAWNGWVWRGIVARYRLRQGEHIDGSDRG